MDLRPLPAVAPGAPFPRELWLLRHAESEANLATAQAWRDGAEVLDHDADEEVALSARGRQQADDAGRRLAELEPSRRPTLALVSPYRRTRETFERMVAAGGLDLPAHTDERLRERDVGQFDRLTGAGLRARHPEEAARRRRTAKAWYRAPGGESWADVALRVRSLVGLVLPRMDGERVLLVTHQAVVMSFRAVLEGLELDEAVALDRAHPQPNTALTRYAVGPAGVALVEYAHPLADAPLGVPDGPGGGRFAP
jgi:broad specificity phosphatase PhoE